MKILTWNINGIRAVIKKGFLDFLKDEGPDLLFLQEIKISEKDIEKQGFDFPGYKSYWNPAQRPGYSGTAVLVKEELVQRHPFKDIFSLEGDDEGRVQILEWDDLYLSNIYFPNAGPDLARLDFKMDFNDRLLKKLRKLDKKKPFVIGGDYNVAHQEMDLARPRQNVGNAGFTKEERAWMDKFLKSGFRDSFRELNPDTQKYSWWTYRALQAREKNIGWRIDYFCVSDRILSSVKESDILDSVRGSDHAPVKIVIQKNLK